MRATYDNTMAALGFPKEKEFRAQIERAVQETNEEADLAYVYLPLLLVIWDAYQQLCHENESERVGDPALIDFIDWFEQFESMMGLVALTLAFQHDARVLTDKGPRDTRINSFIYRLSGTGDRTLGWVQIDEISKYGTQGEGLIAYNIDFKRI